MGYLPFIKTFFQVIIDNVLNRTVVIVLGVGLTGVLSCQSEDAPLLGPPAVIHQLPPEHQPRRHALQEVSY